MYKYIINNQQYGIFKYLVDLDPSVKTKSGAIRYCETVWGLIKIKTDKLTGEIFYQTPVRSFNLKRDAVKYLKQSFNK